jgi:hypothetical protein
LSRITAVLAFVACLVAALLLLEWLGVFAALITLVGLLALVILVLAAVAVAVVAFLSIPYFFITRKMEVREGSFTLDRLEEKK